MLNNSMIFILKWPSGRLGNKALHYLFFRQVAKKLRSGYLFFPTWGLNPFSVSFSNITNLIPRGITFYSSNKIQKNGLNNFFKTIKLCSKQKKWLVFTDYVLGKYFFQTLFYSPNNFISFKKKYDLKETKVLNKKVVMHFRGTDFHVWNNNAILSSKYYIRALDLIRNDCESDFTVYMCTDDFSLDSFKYVKSICEKNKIKCIINSEKGSLENDLYTLSCADYLVSSPSTFAIIGAALGKKKKIIHSKKWVDSRVKAKDQFWVDLRTFKNDHYWLWREV